MNVLSMYLCDVGIKDYVWKLAENGTLLRNEIMYSTYLKGSVLKT